MSLLDRYNEFAKQGRTEQLGPRHRESNILIVDGLNTFIRVFSAVPTLNNNGDHIGGVVGFLKSIASNINQFSVDRCVVVLDGEGGSQRRRKLFPGYKEGKRSNIKLNRFEEFLNPEDEKISMKNQIVRISQYLEVLPITTIIQDRIEADDSIAYIVKNHFEKVSDKITIVSTDKDFLQLVNDKVSIWSPIRKKLYDVESIVEQYGIHPNNFAIFRAMTGDKSDNIAGIKGVGLKTLLKLYPQLSESTPVTVNDIISYAKTVVSTSKKPPKVMEEIAQSEDQLFLNYRLMQLSDVDIPLNDTQQLLYYCREYKNTFNKHKVRSMASKDGLANSINNFDGWLNETFNKLNAWRT